MTPYERVLAEPGSIAARQALAAASDPRKELIEKQLARRALERANDYASGASRRLETEIAAIVASHGRALAGPVADLVVGYRFRRGVVAQVKLSGESWVRVAAQVMALAPIQHLDLCEPLGDLAAVFAVPELARVVTLEVALLDDKFGDAGAIALARSPRVTNLRWIDLSSDAIGEAGVEAIAASPYLQHARFIAFNDNPCDPTPVVYDYDMVKTPSRPPVATRLEQTFGPRPWLALPAEDRWPPDRDEVAITD